MLSNEHLECWRHFVLACRIFCQRSISKDRLKVADILLLRFYQRTERQYERDIITPNMHMACHLSECVMDYGPLNHFWLFAFERFNGILGLLPNNNKSIETQMKGTKVQTLGAFLLCIYRNITPYSCYSS